MLPLAMLAGLMLSGQDASPLTEPPTTLPTVEVVAPADEGVVTLDCRVNRSGTLSDCVIFSETPPGQGFGQAALEAASKSRLSRRSLNPAARDARVRFTTRFRLADRPRP